MTFTELRKKTTEMLIRVKQEPIVLTRRGHPEVVVIDYDTYQEMTAQLEKLGTPQEQKVPSSEGNVRSLIKEMQARYAKYPSFNRALLTERAREREREEQDLRARQ